MTRDDLQFLFAAATAAVSVDVPELGGAVVYLRRLTVSELLAHEAARPKDPNDSAARAEWMARAVTLSVADELGRRLLGDGDLPWVLTWPAPVLGRLFLKVSELSAITEDRVKAAAKN